MPVDPLRCQLILIEQAREKGYQDFADLAVNAPFAVTETVMRRVEQAIGTKVQFNFESAFCLAAKMGRVDVLDQIVQWSQGTTHVRSLIRSDNYASLNHAIVRGHRHVWQKLTQLLISTSLTDVFLRELLNPRTFSLAIVHGRMDAMEDFIALKPGKTCFSVFLKTDPVKAFREGARNGHFDMIEYVLKLISEIKEPRYSEQLLEQLLPFMLAGAASTNRFSNIDRCFALAKDDQQITQMILRNEDNSLFSTGFTHNIFFAKRNAFLTAVINNALLPMIKFIEHIEKIDSSQPGTLNRMLAEINEDTIEYAIANKALDTLTYLFRHYPRLSKYLDEKTYQPDTPLLKKPEFIRLVQMVKSSETSLAQCVPSMALY